MIYEKKIAVKRFLTEESRVEESLREESLCLDKVMVFPYN